jgi:hypothetical protein
MLWDYVYIGIVMDRSAGEPDKPRRTHLQKKTVASHTLEWRRQGEWETF